MANPTTSQSFRELRFKYIVVEPKIHVDLHVKQVSAIRDQVDRGFTVRSGFTNEHWFKDEFGLTLELNDYIPKFTGKIPVSYKLFFPDHVAAVEWKLRWL